MSRAKSILNLFERASVNVSIDIDGIGQFPWPQVDGWEIVDMGNSDRFGTYSIVSYQSNETGDIVDFDGTNLSLNNGMDSNWVLHILGSTAQGEFSSLDDIESILRKVPQKIKKLNKDLEKRLPRVKGWKIEYDIMDLANSLQYVKVISPDIFISATVYLVDSYMHVVSYDNSGYRQEQIAEKEYKFKNITQIPMVLKQVEKDFGN